MIVGYDLGGGGVVEQVIAIPTHRTGAVFLDSLLSSFRDTDSYPILVVINDWRMEDDETFLTIIDKYPKLPITVERLHSNSFELGALQGALSKTEGEEFLLLPHACEIVDPSLLDIVFRRLKGKSIAFSTLPANWLGALGESREFEPIILRHLDLKEHQRLLGLGDFRFIPSLIGKYRRAILEKMDFQSYVPNNIVEAFAKGEYLFSNDYMAMDEETVELFPDWNSQPKFEQVHGKTRKKLENEFIIKWKSHWTHQMIYDCVPHE